MTVFLILFFVSLAGLCLLIARHIPAVRVLLPEELAYFIHSTPSFAGAIKQKYIIPLSAWCRQTGSFLFYHFGEHIAQLAHRIFLRLAKRLRGIADYLHGRKIVMRGKGQSPFWDSMHEWKDELKNESGNKKGEKKE